MAAKDHSASGERSPLLPREGPADSASVSKPLPKAQLAIICFARMMEAWTFFSIFPYISAMIEDTGVEQSAIGFYSGVVESVFSVTQCVFMLLVWTSASDRYGRKPVLVITLAGMSVAAALFGLSQTVWQMVLFRSIGGVFSGSLVTLRLMVAEISTAETQGRAFSLFAFASSMATILAPFAGGFLARPIDRYAFLDCHLFRTFPYLLPSLSTGTLGGIACLLSIFFLEETRPWTPMAGEPMKRPSAREVLSSPGVMPVLLSNVVVALLCFAYFTIAPIFWYTSRSLGGLGLNPRQISILLGSNGVVQAILLLLVFPPVHRHFGTRAVMLIAAVTYVVTYALQPILSLAQGPAFFIVMAGSVILVCIQGWSFTAIQISLTAVSPSPMALGKLNSMCLTASLVMRAITPAAASSLYAIGVQRQILRGSLVWLVLGAISAFLIGLVVRAYPKDMATKPERMDGVEDATV